MSKYTKKKIGNKKVKESREALKLFNPIDYQDMTMRGHKAGLMFHEAMVLYYILENCNRCVKQQLKDVKMTENLKSCAYWLNKATDDLCSFNALMEQHFIADKFAERNENADSFYGLNLLLQTAMGFDENADFITGKSTAIIDNSILPQINSMIASGMLKSEQFMVIMNDCTQHEVEEYNRKNGTL